jgi:hypothetical protein
MIGPAGIKDAPHADRSENRRFPIAQFTVVDNAIIDRSFALAKFYDAVHNDPAFQASSPKTSGRPSGRPFFVRA